MDVSIKSRDGFTVLGLQNRINPMTADYHAIWADQFMPHAATIKALAIEEGAYAVYYPTDTPQMVDMVAGMAVTAGTPAPEGLVVREVPGSLYAVVECRMDAIGPTWAYLFQEWPQVTDYAIDFSKPCFEAYPPHMDHDNGLLTIWIPVLAKA